MKHLDWPMIIFVGTSMISDYWTYWGLPRIYFWEVKRAHFNHKEDDDDHKAA
jgi:hypothetical protein